MPVAQASQEFTQYYPKPGWVEHDAQEIWASQLETAKAAIEPLLPPKEEEKEPDHGDTEPTEQSTEEQEEQDTQETPDKPQEAELTEDQPKPEGDKPPEPGA